MSNDTNKITIKEYIEKIKKDKFATELKDILEIDPNAYETLLCNKCGDSYASQFCEKNNICDCSFDEIKSTFQNRMEKENKSNSFEIRCYLKNDFIIVVKKYLFPIAVFIGLIVYSFVFIFEKDFLKMLQSGIWYILFFILVVLIKQNFDRKNMCEIELQNEKNRDIKNIKNIKEQFGFFKVLVRLLKKYFF